MSVITIAESETRRAWQAVSAIFFIFGLNMGTWAPHIPFAKERLNASPGLFGATLLCMAVGGISCMPAISWLINRTGSAPVIVVSAGLSLAFLPLPFIAPSLPLFAAALFLFGGAMGALDVSMNSHGLIVEDKLGKPVMSSFHAIFSFAGLFGGLVSAVLISQVNETYRSLLSSLGGLLLLVWAASKLFPADVDKGRSQSPLAWPTRATVGLGFLCFLALLIEGATIDWSGIYLRETFASSGTVTAFNFAAYSAGMAISRLLGDRARLRWGPVVLARWSACASAFLLALALTAPNATIALVAFALSGVTLGPIAPLLFAGGGRAEPLHPSRGISAVTTLGYLGIVAGPPLVGAIAEVSSLAAALGLVALLAVVISVFAALTGIADRGEPQSPR